MFRIVCDPSSGGIELYLTEIIRSGSLILFTTLSRIPATLYNEMRKEEKLL